MATPREPIIQIRGLATEFDTPERRFVVHENLDLTVDRGEVLAIVGGSGSGKTVLLRQILGLETPTRGAHEPQAAIMKFSSRSGGSVRLSR